MNYTENYHLPQWVKTDRIMMEDFNQMCADMESGLIQNKQVARRALDRTHRLAYNHFCAVQNRSPFPCQWGIFQQNFEKNPAGLTGTNVLNGKRFAENFSAALTQDAMIQSSQNIQQMHVVKDDLTACAPMKTNFTPPRSGIVTYYYLVGEFSQCVKDTPFRIRIRLVNLDTGGVEVSVVKTMTHIATGGTFQYRVDGTPLHFLGGVHYMITMDCLDAICNMDAQLTFAGSDVTVSSFPSSQTPVTASASLHTPLGGGGGMALLRCVTGGTGGELTFLWDGVEREPAIQQTVRLESGWGCQEFLYLREDDIPEDSTMSLRLTCHPEGSVLLHDWGMILL